MTTGATGFSGFSDAALGFYEGLAADNSKTYWADHKAVYEDAVLAPMLALTAGLAAEFGTPKLFRPYRDVRFSADKSPYKTQLGATLSHAAGGPQFYVQLSSTGLFAGGGYYHFSRDQLDRYRAAVADRPAGAELAAITAALAKAGIALGGDSLTRVPRGVDPAHPRADLLKHKGLAGMRDLGAPAWLATRRCADEVVKTWRSLEPMFGWLTDHVGPAEQLPDRPGRHG